MPMTNVPGKAALCFVCMEITIAWPVHPREEVACIREGRVFAFSVRGQAFLSLLPVIKKDLSNYNNY